MPQWIIREFAAGKNAAKRIVNAYDRKTGQVRRVSPKDVFVKKNLNTISTETGPDDRFERLDAKWSTRTARRPNGSRKPRLRAISAPTVLRYPESNPRGAPSRY